MTPRRALPISAAQKDYIFAEPMSPSLNPITFETVVWDELQLQLYQAGIARRISPLITYNRS